MMLDYGLHAAPNAAFYNKVENHFRESILGDKKAKDLQDASAQRASELDSLGPEDLAYKLGHNCSALPPNTRNAVITLGARMADLERQIVPRPSPSLGGKPMKVSDTAAYNHAQLVYALSHTHQALDNLATGNQHDTHLRIQNDGMPALMDAQRQALATEMSKLDTSKMGPRAMAEYRRFMGQPAWPPGYAEAFAAQDGMQQPGQNISQMGEGQGAKAVAGSAGAKTRKFKSNMATNARLPMNEKFRPA
jgi:hypothetical protein